jgi:hypothetical protein
MRCASNRSDATCDGSLTRFGGGGGIRATRVYVSTMRPSQQPARSNSVFSYPSDVLFTRITNIEERPVILSLGGSLDLLQLMHNFIDGRQLGECDESLDAGQFA